MEFFSHNKMYEIIYRCEYVTNSIKVCFYNIKQNSRDVKVVKQEIIWHTGVIYEKCNAAEG